MAISSLALAITLTILYTTGSSLAADDSITINLLHRDSIDSPFYDHSMTFEQRIDHLVKRSINNAKRFQKGSTYQADIIPDHGEFLMNISFGSPPHKILAIADTGSDVSWMQCKPCLKCYKHLGSIFDPKSSSTYHPVGCQSKECTDLNSSLDISCSPRKTCQFYEGYGDGSYSNGTVSTETVTLGNRVLKNIVFGCSFYNGGIFEPTWDGIVGIGQGPSSLVTQLRSYVTPKFSYCLIPYPYTNSFSNKSSKMIFGHFDFGPSVVSTPLVQGITPTFYHVTLEGISVGDKRLNTGDGPNSTKALKGNMIIDSGTTLTNLPSKLYNEFLAALKEAINVRTMKDPQKVFDLCYRSKKVTKMPKVTMHYDGADVELTRENVFVTISNHMMCLAFQPASGLAIVGNLAQINHLLGFDLVNNVVSFKSANCEKI